MFPVRRHATVIASSDGQWSRRRNQVLPAFEGSERWRRAGTRREHRKDLSDERVDAQSVIQMREQHLVLLAFSSRGYVGFRLAILCATLRALA